MTWNVIYGSISSNASIFIDILCLVNLFKFWADEIIFLMSGSDR